MMLLDPSHEERLAELEEGITRAAAGWQAAEAEAARLQAEVDALLQRLAAAEQLAAVRLDTIAEREARIRELERQLRGEPS